MKTIEAGAELVFHVPGVPAAQGSMRSPARGVVLHSSPSLVPWRNLVAYVAAQKYKTAPYTGAVEVEVAFAYQMPKSGKDRDRADRLKTTTPDLDKLLRAAGDALTGIVWRDDCQVSRASLVKRYCRKDPPEMPGAYFRVVFL